MKGQRTERLSGEFRKEISSIISGELKNRYPGLSAIISVTSADVASDLKSAKVFVSIFDTNEQRREESFEILKDNAGFIRRCLSRVMRLRTVPEIRFFLDDSMEYGAKIDKILSGLDTGNDK